MFIKTAFQQRAVSVSRKWSLSLLGTKLVKKPAAVLWQVPELSDLAIFGGIYSHDKVHVLLSGIKLFYHFLKQTLGAFRNNSRTIREETELTQKQQNISLGPFV